MKTKTIILALLIAASTAMAQHGGGSSNGAYKNPQLTSKYLAALGMTNSKIKQKSEGVWVSDKGVLIYSSHPYGDNIKGFSGATPLFIAVGKNGKIQAVAPAANTETPDFWQRVKDSKLFKAWKGLTPAQAAKKKVDAVSGATYSSTAVIKTVQATANNIK
jgi:Na+-translocating ferredoxin:NAD+ oxidoreductase RnfG subunit